MSERSWETTEGPDEPVVVHDVYLFTRWLLERVAKFPRSHRFVLGDRVEGTALKVLVTLTEAAYTRDKGSLLDAANRHLNVLRCLLRLCRDLNLISRRQYYHAAEQLRSIGRQVGGWRRSVP